MRKKIIKGLILFLTGFIGIGAFYGALMMFIDPTGGLLQMNSMLPYFAKMPFSDILFQDYLFSGIALLAINGIPNIIAFIQIWRNQKAGYYLGYILGITLILWITLQFVLFAPNVYLLDVIYIILGFLQLIIGYLAFVRYLQAEFIRHFTLPSYQVTKQNELVVFFSRDGYTKKLAYEYAANNGFSIMEIKATEKIANNLGFWWCGRFAMHKWGMPIEEMNVNWQQYQMVHLFTPIWVFSIAAPMRMFIQKYGKHFSKISLTTIHFLNKPMDYVVNEVNCLLPNKVTEYHSYRMHFGQAKKIK